MKRFKIFLCLISCSLLANFVIAQPLILGPDTLCIGNQMQLTTNVTNASSYYWGFCSAYLNYIPTGSSIVAGTGLNAPSSIVMAKDSGKYFVFVVNTNGTREVIRYDFTNSLANVPLAVNLGDFGGLIPTNAKGFEIIKTGGKWYGFLVGGLGAASDMIRLDFGTSLSNIPTVVDLGNLGGTLTNPQDLVIFFENNEWHCFTNDGFSGNLLRIDFGASITNSPVIVDLGNPGTLSFPTGLTSIFDGTNWHLFVVNRGTQTLSRLDFGSSLLGAFAEVNLGTFGGLLQSPRDIGLIKDCGQYYGYITNEASNRVTMINFDLTLNVLAASDLNNFGGFKGPGYLTKFLRDKDNVFAFTPNLQDNSMSRISYNSCVNSSIPSSTLQSPPAYTYSAPGIYNVYFVSNEGLPDMKVDCKLITVLGKPQIEINNDTLICQRDTILLVANGPGLFSNLWSPVYHAIAPYDSTSMLVYPSEDYRYNVHLEFTSSGACAYDTSVLVKVSRVTADAGIDRFVADGAYTELGGPRLSMGQEFSYVWTPSLYLNSTFEANPICTPLDVQAYYLTVTNDSTGCVHKDSVWVRTECTEIHLPNAFNPISDNMINRNFGLLNSNIVKLDYFKIMNRWGQVVFETTDPKKTWDGTFKNIELPPDNYVWIVNGYCNNGKRIKREGTVLLVK